METNTLDELANALLGIHSQGLLCDMNALPAEDQPYLHGNSNIAW